MDNESARPSDRHQPISLHPLSFEEVVKALVSTPSMTEKPKRQPKTRSSKKPKT
jgi:hypothetical protein